MTLLNKENLNMKDRITRVTIGCVLAMTPLYIPENTAIFTAAVLSSIYPLLTGLVAIDPVLNAITKIKWRPITNTSKDQAMPHITK